MIDEKEIAINEKLARGDAQNRKSIEEYQVQVENKRKSLLERSAAFSPPLADGDYRRVLQDYTSHEEYLASMTREWFDLEPPTSIEFNIGGLDEFHATRKKSIENVCVAERPSYENPHLEQLIAEQSTSSNLNLNNVGLTDHDTNIVVRPLRKNTVRKYLKSAC